AGAQPLLEGAHAGASVLDVAGVEQPAREQRLAPIAGVDRRGRLGQPLREVGGDRRLEQVEDEGDRLLARIVARRRRVARRELLSELGDAGGRALLPVAGGRFVLPKLGERLGERALRGRERAAQVEQREAARPRGVRLASLL